MSLSLPPNNDALMSSLLYSSTYIISCLFACSSYTYTLSSLLTHTYTFYFIFLLFFLSLFLLSLPLSCTHTHTHTFYDMLLLLLCFSSPLIFFLSFLLHSYFLSFI